MASIELIRDFSRFWRDFQYLVTCKGGNLGVKTFDEKHGEHWKVQEFFEATINDRKKRFFYKQLYLEGPEEPDAPQNRHADGRDDVGHREGHLQDRGDHHEEVKSVEERDEVEGEAEGVHLEDHLESEEDDEEEVCTLLELSQPVRLAKVLRCQYLVLPLRAMSTKYAGNTMRGVEGGLHGHGKLL